MIDNLKQYVPAPMIRIARSVKRRLTVPEHRVAPTQAASVRNELELRLATVGAGPKVIYALTPTADWPNIGDHAQVVAIRRWLAKHYPDREVLELSKDEAICGADILARIVSPSDLFFLHSGGNLGDRGLWSETARRSIIRRFPHNQIVSLPQTISFSDTPSGRLQKRETSRIYGAHRHLTIISRDHVSAGLADDLFPSARRLAMPDFVLSLDPAAFGIATDAPTNGKILACLRNDDESDLGAKRARLLESLGTGVTLFDTHLDGRLETSDREAIVAETLALFAAHEAVVTDRFHGTIFAVLCRKPVVVLRSVDHKLTSGVDWFRDIPNVTLCDHVEDVPATLAEVRAAAVDRYPDFSARYFDRLPGLVAAGKPLRMTA